VFVRAYDRRHHMELAHLDVTSVVREVFESAVGMGRDALLALGIYEEEAERVVADYRDRDRQRLELQSSSGDIRALRELIFSPDNRIEDAQPSSDDRKPSTSSGSTE
jgi:glutathione-regulated potassium-efflux system protein KefB